MSSNDYKIALVISLIAILLIASIVVKNLESMGVAVGILTLISILWILASFSNILATLYQFGLSFMIVYCSFAVNISLRVLWYIISSNTERKNQNFSDLEFYIMEPLLIMHVGVSLYVFLLIYKLFKNKQSFEETSIGLNSISHKKITSENEKITKSYILLQ